MSFNYTEEMNSGKILEELKQIKEMLQDLLEIKRDESFGRVRYRKGE